MIAEYFLMGVIAPSFLNLMHLVMGIYVVMARGNLISLGFTGVHWLDWCPEVIPGRMRYQDLFPHQ